MENDKVKEEVNALAGRSNEPVSRENMPLALGCILDDVAEIKTILSDLYSRLGIGASGLRPVTVKEAAVFLSVSERTVRNMVRERTIPYYERNGKIYFFERELLEWVKESRVATFDEEYNKYKIRNQRR